MCVGLDGDVRGKVHWADYTLAEQTLDEDEDEASETIMKPFADSWSELVAAVPTWKVV